MERAFLRRLVSTTVFIIGISCSIFDSEIKLWKKYGGSYRRCVRSYDNFLPPRPQKNGKKSSRMGTVRGFLSSFFSTFEIQSARKAAVLLFIEKGKLWMNILLLYTWKVWKIFIGKWSKIKYACSDNLLNLGEKNYEKVFLDII